MDRVAGTVRRGPSCAVVTFVEGLSSVWYDSGTPVAGQAMIEVIDVPLTRESAWLSTVSNKNG